MGFEVYWKYEKDTFWKELIRGPFSHGTLPNGVGKLGDELRCFELFALRHGEKLYIGRRTSGLVKAEIVPRDVVTGENTSWEEGAENANRSTGDQSSSSRDLNGLGKTEEDGMESIMGQWNEYYPSPLRPEFVFWTDGGWGCLLRNPAMIAQTLMEGPKGIRGLVSLVCKGDMMDYNRGGRGSREDEEGIGCGRRLNLVPIPDCTYVQIARLTVKRLGSIGSIGSQL